MCLESVDVCCLYVFGVMFSVEFDFLVFVEFFEIGVGDS